MEEHQTGILFYFLFSFCLILYCLVGRAGYLSPTFSSKVNSFTTLIASDGSLTVLLETGCETWSGAVIVCIWVT